jgi:hypothetical protein
MITHEKEYYVKIEISEAEFFNEVTRKFVYLPLPTLISLTRALRAQMLTSKLQ